METSFSPVQYIYREIIEEEIAKQTEGKIFFFDVSGKVDSLDGKVIQLREIQGEGLFIMMDSGAKVRIDRIITLFGKPGAAFDEYDSYANQCLSCTGEYDL
jgi:hypothetical protein